MLVQINYLTDFSFSLLFFCGGGGGGVGRSRGQWGRFLCIA